MNAHRALYVLFGRIITCTSLIRNIVSFRTKVGITWAREPFFRSGFFHWIREVPPRLYSRLFCSTETFDLHTGSHSRGSLAWNQVFTRCEAVSSCFHKTVFAATDSCLSRETTKAEEISKIEILGRILRHVRCLAASWCRETVNTGDDRYSSPGHPVEFCCCPLPP